MDLGFYARGFDLRLTGDHLQAIMPCEERWEQLLPDAGGPRWTGMSLFRVEFRLDQAQPAETVSVHDMERLLGGLRRGTGRVYEAAIAPDGSIVAHIGYFDEPYEPGYWFGESDVVAIDRGQAPRRVLSVDVGWTVKLLAGGRYGAVYKQERRWLGPGPAPFKQEDQVPAGTLAGVYDLRTGERVVNERLETALAEYFQSEPRRWARVVLSEDLKYTARVSRGAWSSFYRNRGHASFIRVQDLQSGETWDVDLPEPDADWRAFASAQEGPLLFYKRARPDDRAEFLLVDVQGQVRHRMDTDIWETPIFVNPAWDPATGKLAIYKTDWVRGYQMLVWNYRQGTQAVYDLDARRVAEACREKKR